MHLAAVHAGPNFISAYVFDDGWIRLRISLNLEATSNIWYSGFQGTEQKGTFLGNRYPGNLCVLFATELE